MGGSGGGAVGGCIMASIGAGGSGAAAGATAGAATTNLMTVASGATAAETGGAVLAAAAAAKVMLIVAAVAGIAGIAVAGSMAAFETLRAKKRSTAQFVYNVIKTALSRRLKSDKSNMDELTIKMAHRALKSKDTLILSESLSIQPCKVLLLNIRISPYFMIFGLFYYVLRK